jgi:hypothetical protein
MFWSAQYANQQASALGINGWCYHGVAAARLFHVFDGVFGSSVSTRVVKVLSGQHANSGVMNCIIQTFNNSTYNPWGTTADAIATAGYFSGSVSTSPLQTHRSIADAAGLDYILYEGGDKAGGYSTYQAALDVFDNYVSIYNNYVSVSTEWGAKKYAGQPLSDNTAGAYRAMLEYAIANHGLDTSAAVVKSQAEPWWLTGTNTKLPRSAVHAVPGGRAARLVHDGAVVRLQCAADRTVAVCLYSPQGGLVSSSTVRGDGAVVCARPLPAGLYLAELGAADGRWVQQLMVR